MLDTKGPEIRSGFFANDQKSISLTKGESIVLTNDYAFKGDKHKLACSYEALAKSVTAGQNILVADGSLVLQVTSCDVAAGEVTCQVMNNTTIGERKNMNLPGVVVDLPTLTEKDVDDIKNWGVKHGVDYIAVSFVRKSSDIFNVRETLGEEGQGIKVISKIENLEGLQNYESILRATDAIMVARGDLGMEIPPEKVFLAQKMMIREANIAGKPVITATQMLESMIQNPRPTRAECSDVANAVLDGTDCVMLSGETANGPYFEEAITCMAGTCAVAEKTMNINSWNVRVRNSTLAKYGTMSDAESIASSAAKVAHDVKAKMIVVLSESGSTARQLAKYRPAVPIICLTPKPQVARQTYGLLRGCYSYAVPSLEDADRIAEDITEKVRTSGYCKEGDSFVLVMGNVFGSGATNQIKVQFIQSHYWDEPPEHQHYLQHLDHEDYCTIM
jgi:pyruvate kinase